MFSFKKTRGGLDDHISIKTLSYNVLKMLNIKLNDSSKRIPKPLNSHGSSSSRAIFSKWVVPDRVARLSGSEL